jgi:hypothetical protein
MPCSLIKRQTAAASSPRNPYSRHKHLTQLAEIRVGRACGSAKKEEEDLNPMPNINNAQIIELTLSGFQAFKKSSSIPISPITLIYGPNSAGKSAIYDALALLRQFFSGASQANGAAEWPFLDALSRRYALASDWHREQNEKYSTEPLTLSVTFSCPDYQVFDPQLMALRYFPFDLLNSRNGKSEIIKATVEFTSPWDRTKLNVTLELDGTPLYRFKEGELVAFNLNHPVFGDEGAILPVCSKHKGNSSPVLIGSWAEIRGNVSMVGPHQVTMDHLAKSLNPKNRTPNNPLVWYESLFEFAQVHNLLLGQLTKITHDACSFDLVEASRHIPTANELTFALTKDFEVADPKALHFQLNSDIRYLQVACSVTALTLEASSKGSRRKRVADDGLLATKINQSLADHLYTERGYRLDVELTKVSPDDHTNFIRKQTPAWLINLCLRDSAGRRLAFTDVGSGIGYVLPAIIALWTTRQCFVQQPELHLHPALQTSLGDVLIEAANNSRSLLVETHSEHILLRILKRIRQTNSDPVRAGAYRIDPNTVSIVYCEPNPDGTTRAVALKITSNGEFVGR